MSVRGRGIGANLQGSLFLLGKSVRIREVAILLHPLSNYDGGGYLC